MDSSVENARKLLRAEVKASSLNAVAARVGIDRSTLRTFVKEGGVERPIGRVLEPILAYAAKRLGSARTGEAPPTPPAGSVTIPLHELTYWRGVLETEHRHLKGLNESMEALLKMLRNATDGIGGFIESGVLPAGRRRSRPIALGFDDLHPPRDDRGEPGEESA